MTVFGGPDIVTDGLVLHLDAANRKSYPGSGTTWYDLSGNGNNANKLGTTSLITWNSNGFFEHRPTSNTTGSYWSINHSAELSPNSGFWTVSGWMKVIGDQSYNGVGWFHKQGSGDERGIHLEPISGNFRANGANGWSQIDYNINNNSIWQSFTFVFSQTSGTYGTNTGNLKFYINGVKVVEDTSFTPKIDAGSPIWLGRRNGHLRHYINADISNYFYHTKSLSDSEIKKNYNALKGRYGL